MAPNCEGAVIYDPLTADSKTARDFRAVFIT